MRALCMKPAYVATFLSNGFVECCCKCSAEVYCPLWQMNLKLSATARNVGYVNSALHPSGVANNNNNNNNNTQFSKYVESQTLADDGALRVEYMAGTAVKAAISHLPGGR